MNYGLVLVICCYLLALVYLLSVLCNTATWLLVYLVRGATVYAHLRGAHLLISYSFLSRYERSSGHKIFWVVDIDYFRSLWIYLSVCQSVHLRVYERTEYNLRVKSTCW